MSKDAKQPELTPTLKELLKYLELNYANWPDFDLKLSPFGFFCSYWPEEISLAAGMAPFRVFPLSGTHNPPLLPAYCCTVAKGCLELGESIKAKSLDGKDLGITGFAHSCDTMQCLGQIWLNTINEKTITFIPPINLAASGAVDYTIAELKRIISEINTFHQTEIKEDEIKKAIILTNKIRKIIERLEVLRPYYPSGFIASLIRVAQLAPRTKYIEIMEENLPQLEKNLASMSNQEEKTRLLISGAVFENEDLHNLLEELGGRVVIDDSCSGYRHFAGFIDEKLKPLEALAIRYLKKPHCPCRHKGLTERADYLLSLVEKQKAQAAIIALRKFCEPHAWDSVLLAEKLKNSGMPVLILEMEGATPKGQERTRLQAFLESVKGGLI